MAYVTGLGGMSYCNQTLLLQEGGVWARDQLDTGGYNALCEAMSTNYAYVYTTYAVQKHSMNHHTSLKKREM